MLSSVINTIRIAIFFAIAFPYYIVVLFFALGIIINTFYTVFTGFTSPIPTLAFLFLTFLISGILMVTPFINKTFYIFPWLYTFNNLVLINIFIISLGYEILSFGYKTTGNFRHFITLIVYFSFIIFSRIISCMIFDEPVENLATIKV